MGPEQLTILERVIRLTRVPYSVGCLVIAILAGGPGTFLVFYVNGFNLVEAWYKAVSVSIFFITPVTQTVPVAQGALEVAVSTLALFVDMYLTRYLRLKVLAAEPKLSPLSPDGDNAYRRAFGLMSRTYGTLLFTFVFFFLYFPARALIAGNLGSLAGIAILSLLANLVYGAAFWVYLSPAPGAFEIYSSTSDAAAVSFISLNLFLCQLGRL